jgi:hypothetical protein
MRGPRVTRSRLPGGLEALAQRLRADASGLEQDRRLAGDDRDEGQEQVAYACKWLAALAALEGGAVEARLGFSSRSGSR